MTFQEWRALGRAWVALRAISDELPKESRARKMFRRVAKEMQLLRTRWGDDLTDFPPEKPVRVGGDTHG